MDVHLREDLVEVPGELPTFASAGVEERAAAIGRIAADSYEYLCGLLGPRKAARGRRRSGSRRVLARVLTFGA